MVEMVVREGGEENSNMLKVVQEEKKETPRILELYQNKYFSFSCYLGTNWY